MLMIAGGYFFKRIAPQMRLLNKNNAILILLFVLFGLAIYAIDHLPNHKKSKTIFQVAPIAALAKNVYDGTYTYSELKNMGILV